MKTIPLEVYYEWVRVAAYFVWENESSDKVEPMADWTVATNQINQKLRREGITVEYQT